MTPHQSKRRVPLPGLVSVDVPTGFVVTVQPSDDDEDGFRPAPDVYVPATPGEQDLMVVPPEPFEADVHVVRARIQPDTPPPKPSFLN